MALPKGIEPQAIIDYIRQSEADRGTRMGCELRQFSAACEVLRTWLGRTWVQKRILTHPYLNPKGPLPTNKFKRASRIVELAEMLLNMQHVEGIEHLLPRLQRGSLEADVAELEGAYLLLGAGIEFKFVEPTSTKGLDYDVEAKINGARVCCEMKAKIESTAPTTEAFLRTLRKARNQVPADTPNAMFVRTPEAWMLKKEGHVAIEEGRRIFFEESDRYSCIIVHAQEWRTFGATGAAFATRIFVHSNPNAKVPLLADSQNGSENWLNWSHAQTLYLGDILCGPSWRQFLERARSGLEAKIREGR